MDPTYVASILSGTLATFGLYYTRKETMKKKNEASIAFAFG